MGVHPNLDLQRSSAYSVSPPGLASPMSAVSLPSTSGEKFFGRIAPISPMSSYESINQTASMSPEKDLGMGRSPKELRNEPPRQQLPSLSSLFAPTQYAHPANSANSANSALSERPSPLFGMQSPSDRSPSTSNPSNPANPANPARPYSSSSSRFPNSSPTLNQPRPIYEPRLTGPRPLLPSVSQTFLGPLSPPLREYDRAHQTSQNSASVNVNANASASISTSISISNSNSTSTSNSNSTSASIGVVRKWPQPSLPDTRRSELVHGAEPSTPYFRPTSEQRAPLPSIRQNFGYDASQPPKVDRQTLPGGLAHAPTSPTSPSHVSTEGAPVKDGLGPKIWTGTHFLPRFVRRAEVPGEGLCYFYDDGTHCKTVIDGEPVNAHWGVTKAGKPRKRLAIACLTCREKKIKCDPDFPRCVQCDKFGRTCRFKNAPRGGHNTSPATSPTEQDGSRPLSGPPPRVLERQPARSASNCPISPHMKIGRPSPELLPGLPSKRMRHSYEPFPPPPTSYPYPMMPTLETKPTGGASWPPRELPRIRDEAVYRLWQPDPYARDSQRTR